MGGFGIQDGYVCIPCSGGYIGIPLWFAGGVVAAVAVPMLLVIFAAMSKPRRDDNR